MQATSVKQVASEERTRWYDRRTLTIIDQVPSSDGTKQVKCTLVQARKILALPSVTSILEDTFCTSHTLIDWQIDQHINAAMAFPFSGRTDDAKAVTDYRDMLKAKANEYRDHTANRGKELHADVERWVTQKIMPSDPVGLRIVEQLIGYFDEHRITKADGEIPVGSKEMGYCGTPDIVGYADEGRTIFDLKTTNLKTFKKSYEKWLLQLGAYRGITRSEAGTKLVQVVADRETGDVRFIDHDDPNKWLEAFLHLFEVWCIIKNYDPRKEYA